MGAVLPVAESLGGRSRENCLADEEPGLMLDGNRFFSDFRCGKFCGGVCVREIKSQ